MSEFYSQTRVGRNDPCQCGSGLKYKKCCGLVKIASSEIEEIFSDELDILWKLINSRFNEGDRRLLLSDPSVLRSHNVLSNVGAQLGSIGMFDEALIFQKRALILRPKNDGYKLNYAATLSMLGKHAEALKIIETVKEGTYRKNVIKANVLRNLEGAESAVPFYERAIHEEPGFYLPYLNLAECHKDDIEANNYWLDRALLKFPGNSTVIHEWVITKLKRPDLWDSLISTEWGYEISTIIDYTVPGSDLDAPKKTEFLKNLSRTINAFSQNDVNKFIEYSKFSRNIDPEIKCLTNSFLLFLCLSLGLRDAIGFYHENLCETCRSNQSLPELYFNCSWRSGNLIDAIEIGAKILDSKPKSEMILVDYLSVLDDCNKTDAAVSEAIRITSNFEIKDSFVKARFYYDLANYSAKLGIWSVTEESLINFQKSNFDELLTWGEYFAIPIINSVPNLILSKIGLKKFDEAKALSANFFGDSQKEKFYGVNFVFSDDYFKNIEEDLRKILLFAEDHRTDRQFQNALGFFIEKTWFKDWCGKSKRVKLQHSFSSLLNNFNAENISHSIARSAAAFRMKTLEDDDYSEIFADISENINNYRLLNSEVLDCFLEADLRQFSYIKSLDFSPVVMGYCKGLELYLRKQIFEKFRMEILSDADENLILEDAKKDKKFDQFRGLVSFIKSGRIELGSMSQILKLLKGSTAQRVKILHNFKNFLDINFPYLLTEVCVHEIDDLALNFRNIAVHERGFSEVESGFVRSRVYKIVNELTKLRFA